MAKHAQALDAFLKGMPAAGEIYGLIRIFEGGVPRQCYETTVTKELAEKAESLLGQGRVKAVASQVIAPRKMWR